MIRFSCLCVSLVLVLASTQLASQALLDPTKPPFQGVISGAVTTPIPNEVADANSIPDPKVSAIFVSETKRYAIINNHMVAEGEKWNHILLSRVNRDSVELSKGQSKKVVKMFDVNIIEESQYVY